MSKAKPLMFGAALGASAMFFAQQYHVIQSHDGLRVIPRAPQQSIGLAYADVRNWGPSQWTDRPELARALMANGATDLISESVASSLADRVSEDTSTLDELRGFLNGSKKDGATEGGLLNLPSLRGSDTDTGVDGNLSDPKVEEENDLFKIPFPQDAKTKPPADPFREARAIQKSGPVQSDAGSRFSADDLMDDRPSMRTEQPARELEKKSSSGGSAGVKSAAEQAKEMEELLFGKPSSGTVEPKPAPKSVPKPAETDGLFEEVTTQLENRAQEALTRAQTAIKDKAVASAESSATSSSNFVREKAAEMVPESAKNLLKSVGTTTESSKAASTSLLDFDPFLEE